MKKRYRPHPKVVLRKLREEQLQVKALREINEALNIRLSNCGDAERRLKNTVEELLQRLAELTAPIWKSPLVGTHFSDPDEAIHISQMHGKVHIAAAVDIRSLKLHPYSSRDALLKTLADQFAEKARRSFLEHIRI